MAVSYAEIDYHQPIIHRRVQVKQQRFEIEAIHFILVYILALFIMAFSPK